MNKYNIPVFACHIQLSHVMDLIEKNTCKLTDQQRANIASLQEFCNIRVTCYTNTF